MGPTHPVNHLVKSGDAPRWLPGSDWVSATSAGSFVTYAMFLPVGTDSRWVPIASLSWGYKISANSTPFNGFGGGGWISVPNSAVVNPHSWRDEVSEPRWDHVQLADDIVKVGT